MPPSTKNYESTIDYFYFADFNYSVIGNYLCHHSSTGNEMSKAGCHAENERKITVIQQIEIMKSNEYPIYFQNTRQTEVNFQMSIAV
ncbi:unnamed protein product [Heterobilharzia americana]|nr:unnamed protein product [Heterobilharzia americana]